MTRYQIDLDMERWNLHLIDVCSLTNDSSQQPVTCFQKDLSRTEYVNEGFYNPAHSFVEIEQEVLPRLAVDISRVTLDGHEDERKEEHDFSNIPVSFHEVDGQYSYPKMDYESGLDGEMGKRLNLMVPVPHFPKVNGEIPSDDEVTSDHQRLLNRLQLYDLEELKILGDGNCQFRSLSDQIYRTPDHHKFVREEVVSQQSAEVTTRVVSKLCSHGIRRLFEENESGEWGDHVTLQAAADFYGVKIFVITSFKDTCYLEILPQIEKSKRTIFLSFWAEVHYNSIYPVGEAPAVKGKKKKQSWWK